MFGESGTFYVLENWRECDSWGMAGAGYRGRTEKRIVVGEFIIEARKDMIKEYTLCDALSCRCTLVVFILWLQISNKLLFAPYNATYSTVANFRILPYVSTSYQDAPRGVSRVHTPCQLEFKQIM